MDPNGRLVNRSDRGLNGQSELISTPLAAGTVPGRTGTYRGPEGYKKFVAWLDEEFSDSHAELGAIIDAGDSVVVGATLRGKGRQSGIPATFTFWQVWAFANGQIVGGQGFANKAQALEAAGLSE